MLLTDTKFSERWKKIQSNPDFIFEYINEIEKRFELDEGRIKAFLPEEYRFERVRAEAQSLIEKISADGNVPPLFGLLVGVKDIFHVDGMDTKAGSGVPVDVLKGKEATSVSILIKSGAIVLGKTVTTQFAYFSPGATTNPYNEKHTPGGSSSGSAAAVGGGLAPMALGTQTIGSVVRPASFCGAVGYKPTYERISRDGVIPLSPTMDHVGFFTNEVKVAEKIASHMILDWKDVKNVDSKPVLGIPRGPYLKHASEEMKEIFENSIADLKMAGYSIQDVDVFANFDEIVANHRAVVAVEAAIVHEEWYADYPEGYAKETIELITSGRTHSENRIKSALKSRKILQSDLMKIMNEYSIDCWYCPSAPGDAPLGLESTGNPIMNLPWTQVGFPSLNLPLYMSKNGLPIGMQLVGKLNEDEALFLFASMIIKSLRKYDGNDK